MPTLKLTVLPENLEYNFRLAQQTYPDAQTAAVVKANGYGLGIENVIPPFIKAGCKIFFVNRLSEGKAVRRLTSDAEIFVLDAFIGSGDGIVHKSGCFVRFKDTLLSVLTSPTTNYLPIDATPVADCIRVSDEVNLFDTVYTPDNLAADAGMEVGADVLIRLNSAYIL